METALIGPWAADGRESGGDENGIESTYERPLRPNGGWTDWRGCGWGCAIGLALTAFAVLSMLNQVAEANEPDPAKLGPEFARRHLSGLGLEAEVTEFRYHHGDFNAFIVVGRLRDEAQLQGSRRIDLGSGFVFREVANSAGVLRVVRRESGPQLIGYVVSNPGEWRQGKPRFDARWRDEVERFLRRGAR